MHCQDDAGRLPDVVATEKMVEAYADFDAARSEEKATRFQSIFTAWGTEVNGRRGIVHVSLDKRRQLSRLCYAVASRGRSTKAVLQSLLGSVIHPFMHCRHLMSTLSETYIFVMNLNTECESALPAAVCDELLGCALVLACAYTDIRAQVSTTISATDATPLRGGACRSVIPQKICQALFRREKQEVNTVL